MKCDIIIPVWDQKALTMRCIESIKRNTRTPYKIFIVDNGSREKTREYLEELKIKDHGLVTLIRNEKNLGFPKAVNQGISSSGAPYVCILNNDSEVCEDWLAEMIKIAESSEDIGIVNPASNNLGQKSPLKDSSGKWMEMSACIGFCMLIKRRVIEHIGGFDEIYSPGNFEDTDFSKQAIKNGYRCVMARGAYVYHRENTSFKKRKDWDRNFQRNKRIFCERWGTPLRVAYIIHGASSKEDERLKKGITRFLKSGDRVWVFSKSDFNLSPPHASLTIREVKGIGLNLVTLWHVIKKKKKFNLILTDNTRFFSILKAIKKFLNAKLIDTSKYIFLEDSDFLRVNLGCLGRAYYGFVNIDEARTHKKVLTARFTDLPIEDRLVKNILLDYNAIKHKRNSEVHAILKELERVSVPGCILNIDNFDSKLQHILEGHHFEPIRESYDKLYLVRGFFYAAPYVKDDLRRFLDEVKSALKQKGRLTIKVLNERLFSEKGEAVFFFDKASIVQLLNENRAHVDFVEVKGQFIEITIVDRNAFPSLMAPEQRKRICAIGQYMLLRYTQLGFTWDGVPRAFERLGMDYLLFEGMRNLEYKKIQEAIFSFKPHYLLIILKDTLPIVLDIKKELKSMGTKVIYWFCDPEQPKTKDLSGIIDTMFITNRGQLGEYKDAYNLERVYYMPQGFDPYTQHRLNMPEEWDVGFAGVASDVPLHKTRKALIQALEKRYTLKRSNTSRNNIAEFYAQTKTAFGASDFDYALYTSNRFYVALGCGACYVTKKFKGIELLAENRKHLLWFETKQELFDILDYYLSHDSEREKIRQNAARLALEKHTYGHRLRNIMGIMEGKTESFYGFL